LAISICRDAACWSARAKAAKTGSCTSLTWPPRLWPVISARPLARPTPPCGSGPMVVPSAMSGWPTKCPLSVWRPA
jgi:hypothetical protein